MKYSILGFNQEKIINNEYDIDLIDLTLLDYVYTACSRPSMLHTFDDDKQPYVWLKHSKILEDLPILKIGEEALKKRLKNLVSIGLLKVIVTSAESKGRRAYYTITPICEELRYNDQVYQNTLDSARPSVSKYTSDNLLNNNSKLNTDNTNVLSGEIANTEEFLISPETHSPKKSSTSKTTPKKRNLYSSCIEVINNFTEEEDVRECLRDFLNMRIANTQKPFGVKSFEGMLKKLRTLTTSKKEVIKIITQATDRCYLTFYPITGYSYSKPSNPEIISKGEKRSITDEEFEEAIKFGQKF